MCGLRYQGPRPRGACEDARGDALRSRVSSFWTVVGLFAGRRMFVSSYFFVRTAVCVSCRVTHVSIFIESITAVSTLTVLCNMQRTITHGAARFSSHLLARSAQHLGKHCVFVGAHGPHQVGCGVIIEAVTEHKVLE